MMELGGIRDDELWWSLTYSGKASQPNCIVGQAFMVHFSYCSKANAGVGFFLKSLRTLFLWNLVRLCLEHCGMLRIFFLDLCVCSSSPKAPACENKIIIF